MSAILLTIILLLPSFSIQHYDPDVALNDCIMALFCNHTTVTECGKDGKTQEIRLFLDECDRFEYNCDNEKAFNKTDDSACEAITTRPTATTTTTSTSTTTTTPTTTTPTTTTPTITTPTTTTPTTTTSSTSTTTTTEAITTSATTDSPTDMRSSTTATTLPQLSSRVIHECTCQQTQATTSLPTTATTSTSTLTTTTSPNPSASTSSISPMDASETTNCTRNTPQRTATESKTTETPVKSSEESSSILITSVEAVTSMTITDTVMTTTIPTTILTKTTSALTTSTTTTRPPDGCGPGYPKECDRPVTWETTPKGETRDYFQILKSRYGRRARLMKATTHFPPGYIMRPNTGHAFIYGRHRETSSKENEIRDGWI